MNLRGITADTVLAARYQVLRQLGSGAVGRVLLVSDQQLDNQLFALKLIHEGLLDAADSHASAEIERRLRSEVIIARQLSHPNIVRVYELECPKGMAPFITMEFIDGCSLTELLHEYSAKGMPYQEGVYLMQSILQGLSFAHSKGVVHRDLKPENVLIDRGGMAKLVDFGLATSFEESLGFTKTGQSIGTPEYMAPELFLGASNDPRVDVYAAGVLMYRMFSGVLPFEASSFYEFGKKHREQLPSAEPLRVRGVPERSIEVVMQCLEKEPSKRPANTRSLMARLDSPDGDTLKLTMLDGALQRQEFSTPFYKRPYAIFQIVWTLNAWLLAVLTLLFVSAPSHRAVKFSFDIEQFYGVDLEWWRSLVGYGGLNPDNPQQLFELLSDPISERLNVAIHAGANMFVKNEFGRTLLHEAVIRDTMVVNTVVNIFEDVSPSALNVRDSEGTTALQYAVDNQNEYFAAVLLLNGASLEISDASGRKPLHSAVKRGPPDLVRAVLKNAKNLNRSSKDAIGDTALHVAVKRGDATIVRILLSRDFDPDLRDSGGYTPLMVLLRLPYSETHAEIARILLRRGASLDAVSNDGQNIASLLAQADSNWLAVFSETALDLRR